MAKRKDPERPAEKDPKDAKREPVDLPTGQRRSHLSA